jgi:hypothetical protein
MTGLIVVEECVFKPEMGYCQAGRDFIARTFLSSHCKEERQSNLSISTKSY